jgi:hypothetical protein
METPGSQWPIRLKILFGAVFVFGVGLTAVGIHFAGDKRTDGALEIAKAGIELAAITILGAILAQGLKDLDHARDERRRLNEYRLTVFHGTVDAYNQVKTVRRSLRSIGVLASNDGARCGYTMTAFSAQMHDLNQAELSFERVGREIRANSGLFKCASSKSSSQNLKRCEAALNRILYVWESGALNGLPHSRRQEAALNELRRFLASRRKTRGGADSWEAFWNCFDAFEGALRSDLAIAPRRRRGLRARLVLGPMRRRRKPSRSAPTSPVS